MTEPQTIPSTPRRARIARWMSAAGLVGLCVSSFLPQVEGVVPAACVFEMRLGRAVGGFVLLLFFPFYFAFAMLVLYLLRVFLRGEAARRGLSHAACALALLAFLPYDALCAWALIGSGGLSPANLFGNLPLLSIVASAGVGTVLVGAIWAKCPRAARPGACVAVAGFAFISYFLFFFVMDTGLRTDAGLWVSLVASGLMAAGGLFEAVSLRESTP